MQEAQPAEFGTLTSTLWPMPPSLPIFLRSLAAIRIIQPTPSKKSQHDPGRYATPENNYPATANPGYPSETEAYEGDLKSSHINMIDGFNGPMEHLNSEHLCSK